MDGVGSSELVGVDVGEAEVADQIIVDQLGDRTDGVLDRYLGVGEVRVDAVDAVDAEAAEAGLGVASDVARLGVDRELAVGVADREGVALDAVREAKPNFVATTTRSRQSAIAAPTMRSLWPSTP